MTGTATIPGLDVCTVNCNLVTASPCGAGATCVAVADGSSGDVVGSECFVSGLIDLGETCAHAQDCQPGLLCYSNACSLVVQLSHDPCSGQGLDCLYFNPEIKIDGTNYGSCG